MDPDDNRVSAADMMINKARREPDPKAVKDLFESIASQYENTNRWISWGQDTKWRREVIRLAGLPPGGRLLDIGTGTGGLALKALRMNPSLHVVGADFSPGMMVVGRKRQAGEKVWWIHTDVMMLPFPAGYFDAVVSGYVMRNVADVEHVLSEQFRVLKQGGRMVILETSPPPQDAFHFPVRWYLRYCIPCIGRIISGDGKAYEYLAQSTQRFLQADALAKLISKAGFREVGYQHLMGGVMAIHWGVK